MQNLHRFMCNIVVDATASDRVRRRQFVGFGVRWAVLASAGWGAISAQAESATSIRVLAASDLKFALTRIASEYQK